MNMSTLHNSISILNILIQTPKNLFLNVKYLALTFIQKKQNRPLKEDKGEELISHSVNYYKGAVIKAVETRKGTRRSMVQNGESQNRPAQMSHFSLQKEKSESTGGRMVI